MIASGKVKMQRLGELKKFKDRNLRLKGADIATQRGWTGIPNFILESDRISVGAIVTKPVITPTRLASEIGVHSTNASKFLLKPTEMGML
jgi:hypothetical protein